MVIDFHVHVVSTELVRKTAGRNVMNGWGARPVPPMDRGAMRNSRMGRMIDPQLAIEDMDRLGIDRYVLSASMVAQNSSWAPPQTQAVFEAKSNDNVARWVSAHPDRFVGLATLPLKDVELSLSELGRALDRGLAGVNLPATMDSDYLGAPRFHPIWEAIRELDLPVFIHPDGAREPFFQEYSLWNSVGQPIEEAKLIASLILEGVLERYPGLKIVISHGGGYLPHYVGRLDRNVTNMPDSVRNISRAPSEYLRELYYDTCLYDVSILEALVDRYGSDRVVMGSDYPVGESDPIGFVRRARNIDQTAVARVTGETAATLLGLA